VTLREALQRARELLSAHGIENAPLTAEVLLRHVRQITKVRLYQDLDENLTAPQEAAFSRVIKRHLKGEPVAYITGHKEFFGLDFAVDGSVLIPRPETELLVEKALEIAKTKTVISIADIGTGSGAVAITLALNLPSTVIYAVDISPQALTTARNNSVRYNLQARIHFLEGDLLEPLPEPVELVVANLPYVKEAELNEPSIRYEPKAALDGGPDGLMQIRRFIPQIKDKLKTGGLVLLEIGLGQSEAVKSLVPDYFPAARITAFKDFNNIERVICVN